jgi:DNA-binding LacI/PurR family transcriptional regulator
MSVTISTMATMAEVAKHAGVGIGTVSRALNGGAKVSDAAMQRIREAADEIGYCKTRKTLSDQPKRGRLIGVLVPFFDEASPFQRLRGIVSRLAPHGCDVVILNVASPEQARAKLVELPRNTVLDGLIIVSLPILSDEGERLAGARFPTVLVDTAHPSLPSVRNDDRAGGALATKHLIDLGHSRIAFVGEQPQSPFGFVASAHREDGYRRAMRDASLPIRPEFVRYGAYLHAAARQMGRDLLQLPDPPTAVVAASDTQAVGCLDAARQLGRRVPEDLSIIGYDDIELASTMGLSTVRQPLLYSGERGADLIIEALAMRPAQPSTEVLELELVVRSTTSVVSSGA